MARVAIENLAWLTEQAFEADPEQSLLANLRDLREQDWNTLAPGTGRTIAEILEHVGWAKWMYEDYAFGPATLVGDRPPLVPADGAGARPRQELLPGSRRAIGSGWDRSRIWPTMQNWTGSV